MQRGFLLWVDAKTDGGPLIQTAQNVLRLTNFSFFFQVYFQVKTQN